MSSKKMHTESNAQNLYYVNIRKEIKRCNNKL